MSILSISLFRAAEVTALSQIDPETSSRQFYLNSKIKPDHVLYPLVSLSEQAKLMTMSESDRINQELLYADQRLRDGEQLVEQDEMELALATIIKAEQFLFSAIAEWQQLPDSDDGTKLRVITTLEDHHQRLKHILESCPTHHHPRLNDLLEQQQMLLQQLQR